MPADLPAQVESLSLPSKGWFDLYDIYIYIYLLFTALNTSWFGLFDALYYTGHATYIYIYVYGEARAPTRHAVLYNIYIYTYQNLVGLNDLTRGALNIRGWHVSRAYYSARGARHTCSYILDISRNGFFLTSYLRIHYDCLMNSILLTYLPWITERYDSHITWFRWENSSAKRSWQTEQTKSKTSSWNNPVIIRFDLIALADKRRESLRIILCQVVRS